MAVRALARRFGKALCGYWPVQGRANVVICMRRGGNEGPGEHRAVEKQEQGAPPDTRETGGLPPPNIPYFEGLSEPSKEEKEARTREYSGTLVQPPEPPEMRAATKAAPLGGPPPGAPQPCQHHGVLHVLLYRARHAGAS